MVDSPFKQRYGKLQAHMQLGIRVPKYLHECIKQRAMQKGLTVSDYVRGILDRELDREALG